MVSKSTLSRSEISEEKFKHQIDKAFRKNKLILINLFNERNDMHRFIVDPALMTFNYIFQYNNINFTHLDAFGVTKNAEADETPFSITTKSVSTVHSRDENKSIELDYRPFLDNMSKHPPLLENSNVESIYQLFLDTDPTPNKEYLQWLITLYVRILKDRVPRRGFYSVYDKSGGVGYRFFEDLVKVKESLTVFHKLKKSNVLTTKQKDIYNYNTIEDFVETVFIAEIPEADDNTMEILTAREWEQIHNSNAEIVHQDPDWIVVHTKNKESNDAFGLNTTWCTAGTRYGNMFSTYDKQGPLYVLIKNNIEANRNIKKTPDNRMQFHFESNQFMNALDKRVDVAEFFKSYLKTKEFLKPHVIKMIQKKNKKGDIKQISKLLQDFGLIEELIPILIKSKIKVLTIKNMKFGEGGFELQDLYKVKTLEDVTISDSNLTEIPEVFRKMKQLRGLKLQNNTIKEVPEWINELVELEIFNVMGNNLSTTFDVSKLTKLLELNFGFNKELGEMPTGLSNLKSLLSIDFPFCKITEINDDILLCSELNSINAVRNRSLSEIPFDVIKLPKMKFIGIDDTNVFKGTIKKMVDKAPQQLVIVSND